MEPLGNKALHSPRFFFPTLSRLLLRSYLFPSSLFYRKKNLRAHTPSTPLLSHCISCIVNSSQKHDKVSAHVPPASLSVLPAICYCLCAIVCVCLYHAFFILFFLCVRKAKVN